jgi:hypothetical protein
MSVGVATEAATDEEASESAGDNSRNTAARADAISESSASLAWRRWSAGAGAADAVTAEAAAA